MSRVVLDRAALNTLLTSKKGPVAKELGKRASKVQACAKRNAPVDYGVLRNSIDWNLREDGKGLFARVGSSVNYAAAVHEGVNGTFPVRSHTRKGSTVRAHMRTVNRPADPFLSDCLPAAKL